MTTEVIIIGVLSLVLLAVLALLWSVLRQRGNIIKATRVQEGFLQHVSDEIRLQLKQLNELATTLGQEDLYLSKNEKRDISEQLLHNTHLIATWLDETLLFANNAGSGHPLKMESFSPNALCRRCLEANMTSIYHRSAVKLHFRRELSDEFFVNSDRHLVELLVSKLVTNACKFTEQGEIIVGCNTTDNPGLLTISVSDTGGGIPESRKSRMFSYFERPDDMNDEAELDLSICQRVAEKLGGELIYDANYQKGTRFMLALPMR